ncbi:MAG TPA: hypothetical protein PLO99_07955 [Chitinophagaceae bacterium]|nr:hypothetical protein [Chitinophagaceae bacterium]HRG92364.1 hypothetical protein [Chitinophagaceae bacterium]
MRTKIFLIAILAIIFLESCSRSFTPYEAANSPRGRKCGNIR